jgi:hypothetical protein
MGRGATSLVQVLIQSSLVTKIFVVVEHENGFLKEKNIIVESTTSDLNVTEWFCSSPAMLGVS